MRNKKEQARFPHWLKQALMLLQEFIYYKPNLCLTAGSVNELGRLVKSFITNGIRNGDGKSYLNTQKSSDLSVPS
ncbi:hypothetical protein MRBBS_1124 [Marinobacter sp. BSs20148]|jgi:hypothetical protein|nr:hypothetical protein MRBBS_1124 [Marinobacter sp. BSs20148]